MKSLTETMCPDLTVFCCFLIAIVILIALYLIYRGFLEYWKYRCEIKRIENDTIEKTELNKCIADLKEANLTAGNKTLIKDRDVLRNITASYLNRNKKFAEEYIKPKAAKDQFLQWTEEYDKTFKGLLN